MLQLRDEPKTTDGHEKVFLARYHQALKWARHFSTNRPWQASDLVQDAFLQFIVLRPDLDQIRDLDAFLYAIVRNVHRSLLHRHLRFPHLSLSALDFDSASEGVRLADKEVLQSVIDDLIAVCDFTCERKEVSKTGSLLILRFFHGYSVLETAALMGMTRGAVNERLRHARRDARAYLLQRRAEALGKVVTLSSSQPARVPRSQALEVRVRESVDLGQNEIIDRLRSRIFRSAQGDCLSQADLKTIYAPSLQKAGKQQPVDHLTLAHIVSCHGCLDRAAACLGLPSLDDQEPPADSPGSGPASSDSSRQHIGRWRGKFEKLLDQTPEEIHIAVNGLPLASEAVSGGRSDLSISVPIQERIDFVEIFSEHDVRLLMLPVLAVPPEGECEQTGHLDFSDGRTLSARLVFDHPWPTLHVQYGEPEPEQVESGIVERTEGVRSVPSNDRPSSWFSRLGVLFRTPPSWMGPRFWSGLVAVSMIVILLFVQTRETTASAAVLLSRAEEWERTAAAGLVLHRTFDLVEKSKGSSRVEHRRVEVWRKPNSGMKFSQLIDESGRLIEAAKDQGTLPPLTEQTAWRFEPASDTYRALAGNLESSRVNYKPQTIELAAPALRLTLNRSDYSPIREVLDAGEMEFQFQAVASESIPERQSPVVVAHASVAPRRHIREIPAEAPPVVAPAGVDLDQTELAARLALHELKADLGEDVRIRRDASVVEVAGIVDSKERKEALTHRLGNIGNLRVSLLSPDDVTSRNDIAATLSTPPAAGNKQPPVLAEWLLDQFPDVAARHAFVLRILEASRNCLRRVYALRLLSERYADAPPPEVKQMARNHIQELSAQWSALEELLAPLFPPAVSWRESARGELESGTDGGISRRNDIVLLFTNMKTLDQDVGVLFTEHAARESDPPSRGSQPDIQEVLQLKNSIAKAVAQLSRN